MTKRLRTAAQIATSRSAFGYPAVDDTTRRRKPTRRSTGELSVLTPSKRETASATARDDRRGMTILAWMIRRHLDNVSRFTPHCRIPATGERAKAEVDAVSAVIKRLLRWHSKPRQFDALGKHGRDEWLRMFEATKVLVGDAGGLKARGGHMQGIEGDRIAKKAGCPKEVGEDGLVLSSDGAIDGYCLCKRAGAGGATLEFERVIPARDMVWDAYWPERFDSNRGVSPLLTALNEGADVRETWEWLVLKAKTSALFGLAFTRKSSDSQLPGFGDPPTAAPSSEAGAYTAQMADSVKARSIINLDLDEGDDVKEIESRTPSTEVVSFTRELIRSVLLALDIPFTFYDSLTASFSARIADRNEYEEACEWKRDKNTGVLDEIYGGWLIPIWEKADLFGLSKTLKAAKLSVEELNAYLQWVPNGRAWLDRSNEMSGHILALAAGVTSIPRICAAYGEDAYDIADEQREYLANCGIPMLYAQGGQVPVNDLLKEARNGQQDQAK